MTLWMLQNINKRLYFGIENTKSRLLVATYNNPNLSGFWLAKCRKSACDSHCGAWQSYRMKLSEQMGKGNLEERQAFLADGVKWMDSNAEIVLGLISWYCYPPSFP